MIIIIIVIVVPDIAILTGCGLPSWKVNKLPILLMFDSSVGVVIKSGFPGMSVSDFITLFSCSFHDLVIVCEYPGGQPTVVTCESGGPRN